MPSKVLLPLLSLLPPCSVPRYAAAPSVCCPPLLQAFSTIQPLLVQTAVGSGRLAKDAHLLLTYTTKAVSARLQGIKQVCLRFGRAKCLGQCPNDAACEMRNAAM